MCLRINLDGRQRTLMQKAICTLFALAFTALSAYAGAAEKEYPKEDVDNAATKAWEYFQSGQYDKSRAIVDKYFRKDNRRLALLSGALYSREDKCVEAM